MKQRTKSIIAAAIMMALPASAIASDTMNPNTGSCPYAAEHGSAHGAHGHHTVPGESPGHIRSMLKGAERIGLSEKQREKIGELLIAAESDAARAHAEAEVTVAAFKSRLHAGDVTDKEVNAYTKKMGELRAARLAANLKASVAASRLLSDEQKAKLYGGKGK